MRRLIRSAEGLKNAIIFCNRKREVALLHRSLVRHGFSALALHGDMDQPSRTAALEEFRRGEVALLVASDVAARGLDIPDVSHVFNFDVPHHPDDYVHRIGRTGRAGRAGAAITLVAPADGKSVAAIEKLIGQDHSLDGRAARRDRCGAAAGRRARRGPRRPARSPCPAARAVARTARAITGAARSRRPPARCSPHGASSRPPRPRREQPPASVTHIEAARPRPGRKPAERERPRPEPVDSDEAALSHLPAFLLRPVRVKA